MVKLTEEDITLLQRLLTYRKQSLEYNIGIGTPAYRKKKQAWLRHTKELAKKLRGEPCGDVFEMLEEGKRHGND